MNIRSLWLVDSRSTKQLRPTGYRPYEIMSFCLVEAPKTKQNQATKLQEICLVDLLGRCLSLEKAKPSYQANLDQRSGIGGAGNRVSSTHTTSGTPVFFLVSPVPGLRSWEPKTPNKTTLSPDAKWDFLVTKHNLFNQSRGSSIKCLTAKSLGRSRSYN